MVDESKAFIQQPGVQKSAVWKTLFESAPPRGTIARVARRLSVRLHSSAGKVNYRTLSEFRHEIHRMRQWYKPGSKSSRRCFEIRRRQRACQRLRGIKSVLNKKVALHYKRLLKKNASWASGGGASVRSAFTVLGSECNQGRSRWNGWGRPIKR